MQYAHIMGWTLPMMGVQLAQRLTDKARDALKYMQPHLLFDFTVVDSMLSRRFAVKSDPNVCLAQLHKLRQKADQSLEQFADSVEDQARGAYPDFTEEQLQREMVRIFVAGLYSETAQWFLMREHHQTLAQALSSAGLRPPAAAEAVAKPRVRAAAAAASEPEKPAKKEEASDPKLDKLLCSVGSVAKTVGEFTVRCKLCNADLSVAAKGIQALKQHANTFGHKTAAAVLRGTQMVLARRAASAPPLEQPLARGPVPNSAPTEEASTSRPHVAMLRLMSARDAAMRAELIWVLKCVQGSYSLLSCDNFVDTLKAMLGEEHIPDGMSLGRTKAAYLMTDALGPYFRNLMLEDARKAVSYSVCYDETTNAKHRKELQIGFRFWSEKSGEVVFKHLETFFIGIATGEVLKTHVLQAINNADLVLEKLVMASCDGPNVNKTVLRLISDALLEVRPNRLLDAGTCNLHILHNSFLEGLKVFGLEVSDLVVLVHKFFCDFPARIESFQTVQQMKKVPQNMFLKHVSSRWLTLSPAVERLLEQWPALQHYFLREIAGKTGDNYNKMRESYKYKFICKFLKDPMAQAELKFVIHSATLFERFSKFFQKSEPLVHVLYEEIFNLYILLIGRICKPEAIKQASTCLKEDFFTNSANLLPLDKIEIGEETVGALKNCAAIDVLKFRQNVQKHFQSAARHLLEKSVLGKWPDSKYFRCLNPLAIKHSKSVHDIVTVHKALKLRLDVVNDDLRDEWKLLQLDTTLPTYDPTSMRVDHFWKEIFAIKNAFGDVKYPSIAKVVKAALPIAHGSADVERGFSESKFQMPANRANTEERLHNARLNINCVVKEYGGRPDTVPITKELINAGHFAYKNYNEYLIEKRRAKEEELRKKEEEENERRQREAAEADQQKRRETLAKLQKELEEKEKQAQAERNAAADLVQEATKKLADALSRNDLAGAKVAQGMLEGAKNMSDRAASFSKTSVAPLQKTVKKRTSSLLENLFKNHAKRPKSPEQDNPDDPDALF
ncbi:hypothetical protein FOCC_FOCC016123 [Frankliniella occidentalis]|nr:hypothetical protein FOCC_FOCC016123 [Frankliniella occidentalis]